MDRLILEEACANLTESALVMNTWAKKLRRDPKRASDAAKVEAFGAKYLATATKLKDAMTATDQKN